MSRLVLLTLVMFVFNSWLPAQEGLRYVGDLNGDGIPDRIESGPYVSVAGAGGAYLLTLSSPSGALQFDLYGYGTYAVEMVQRHAGPATLRLWTYQRSSAAEGSLITYAITAGKMTEERLTINPGDAGTALGNELFRLVFAKNNIVVAERVVDYTPPTRPAHGGEWGK